MIDALAQMPSALHAILWGVAILVMLAGAFALSESHGKPRRQKVGISLVLVTVVVMGCLMGVSNRWVSAGEDALAAAVDEKYGIELTGEQVSEMSASSASWLTIDGERMACVLERKVAERESLHPVVESVHLVCGEELAVAG